jgi:hypothetical protein
VRLVHLPEADAVARVSDWLPYLCRVAIREGRDYREYINEIASGECRLFLVERDGVKGACTTRVTITNGEPTGELHWLAGDDIKTWFADFVPAVEKTFQGVARFEITGRKGFARLLKPHGYTTHKVILRKKP